MWIHRVKSFLRSIQKKGLQLPYLSTGMMALFWVMLWSTLPHLALLSDLERCTFPEINSPQTVSSVLDSLECHNDYMSYVQCEWKEAPHINTPLQLFFKKESESVPCEPYGDAVQDADDHRIVKCRFDAEVYAVASNHTVFFNKTLAPCSSAPHEPLHLSKHLRARPPVDLSMHDSGDGGWRLIWFSPYPSSSSLSKNLKYQLSYRPDRHASWTIKDVTSTNMTLEKQSLLPGCRYEARVRAQASVGQWSDWSSVVTWQTEEAVDAVSNLHCVLDGEKEVMCSWEVSEELTHFITYQLACRHNHSAPSKGCCVNQTVTRDLSGSVLRYSCSLNVTDPAHLLLELIPTRNAKTFHTRQHIRPNPPLQVKVKEDDGNWIVEWTEPRKSPFLSLNYQVCYNMTQHQDSCIPLNITDSSTSLTIPKAYLASSQQYQVKVRSLVRPGSGSTYEGTPSTWTDPVDWTTHAASQSVTNLIYFVIGVFVITVFCTLYYTIPACQRRVVVWVESVPSPGKSKILSEIKSATSRSLMQSENTYICKVLNLDSLSTCSSDTSLWPIKDTDKKHLEQYRDCWNCDNLLSPAEKVNGSDTSSMSFSGPYIFCQTPESKCNSVEDKCEEKWEKKEEISSHDTASASPENFTLYGEGYVCLPNRSASRSTQDLVSHSDANTSTHRHDNAEQDQQCPDNTPKLDKVDIQPGLNEPTSCHQPPAYTSGPFTPWPQGGTVQASGYCLLPTDLKKAAQ